MGFKTCFVCGGFMDEDERQCVRCELNGQILKEKERRLLAARNELLSVFEPLVGKNHYSDRSRWMETYSLR